MTIDPYAALREAALKSVLQGPGHTDPALRDAVAQNAKVPGDLAPLVGKIHNHAYRVTDADVAALQQRYDDDALFEIVVSAALGASAQRLDAALAALERA